MLLSEQTDIHGQCQGHGSYKACASAPTMVPLAQHNSSRAAPVPSKRRRTHTRTTRNFACDQCHDVYNSLRDLHHHTMNTHKSYLCMHCNVKFTKRCNLQRHALQHGGFKLFGCAICAQSYFRKDYLMRHLVKSHPGHPIGENIRVLMRSYQSEDVGSSRQKTEKTISSRENEQSQEVDE